MHCQLIGLREVNRMKFHARLHEVRDERHVAGEPVKLGNDQGRAMQPAEFQRLSQFGAIAPLTAFNLRQFGHELPLAAIEVVRDGRGLRLQAEAGMSLPLRRNPAVGDEIASMRLARFTFSITSLSCLPSDQFQRTSAAKS
jgi:hypothetical protein